MGICSIDRGGGVSSLRSQPTQPGAVQECVTAQAPSTGSGDVMVTCEARKLLGTDVDRKCHVRYPRATAIAPGSALTCGCRNLRTSPVRISDNLVSPRSACYIYTEESDSDLYSFRMYI